MEKKDLLTQLNLTAKEENKEEVQVPGWPAHINSKERFITNDCVKFEG